MTGNHIAVVMAIDDHWVPHLATCAASMAVSKGREAIRIHLLHGPTLSAESVQRISEYVRSLGMETVDVTVTDELLAQLPPQLFYNRVTWSKMMIPELLPHLDRALFLDADTVVLHSLLPLWEYELGDKLLGAVGTAAGQHGRVLGFDPAEPYLNTGLMVMDLASMRDEKIGQRTMALGRERPNDFIFAEQDAINVVVRGRWAALPPKWNATSYLWLSPAFDDPTYPTLDFAAAKAAPAIVHFEGHHTIKPWYYRSVHPLRHLYREFRAQTPWPLAALEGKSAAAFILRALPLRWQYTLTGLKARLRTTQ